MKDVSRYIVLMFWEGCSFHFGGVSFIAGGAHGPFLGVPGVSASHAPTCAICTESNGHVINYCPVTRSKVNNPVL